LFSLGYLKSCSATADHDFFMAQQVIGPKGRRESATWGMVSPEGKWVIDPVIKGKVTEEQYFVIIEANADPCCSIGGVNFIKNQSGHYLIFNKKGEPMIPTLVDEVNIGKGDRFVIYKLDKKYGLISSNGFRLDPQYDELRSVGNGWILARQGEQWGFLKEKN
jgi:hypothetical protein